MNAKGRWAPYRFLLLSCLIGGCVGGAFLATAGSMLVQVWLRSFAQAAGGDDLHDTYYVVVHTWTQFRANFAINALHVLLPVSIGNVIVIGLASARAQPGFIVFTAIYAILIAGVLIASPLRMFTLPGLGLYAGTIFVACGIVTALALWLTCRTLLVRDRY